MQMTQDKFGQARRKKAYRGTSTDDNADGADLDKSNAQVIFGQFRMYERRGKKKKWAREFILTTAVLHGQKRRG